MSESEYKTNVLGKYNSALEGITLRGFKDWFKAQIVADGEEVVWSWLDKLGYDRDLYSVKSRLYNITLHSRCIESEETPIEVMVRDAVGYDIDISVTRLIL